MKKLVFNKQTLPILTPTTNPFESLVRSIIFQQLSGKAASAILAKFVALFNSKKPTKRGTRFPKPDDVLGLTDTQFRSAGVSLQKAGYLRDLARKFLDKTIDPKKFVQMTDTEIEAHLVQVKGIGTWTAHMFLIFALNRPDVLPTGDLAIGKGFVKAFGLRSAPSHERMLALANPYIGERTYLALYLWSIADKEKEKKT